MVISVIISLQFLKKEKSKQEEEVAALKKEVVALTIMKLNYEQIVSAHQSQPGQLSKQISDEVKFQVVSILMSSQNYIFFCSGVRGSFPVMLLINGNHSGCKGCLTTGNGELRICNGFVLSDFRKYICFSLGMSNCTVIQMSFLTLTHNNSHPSVSCHDGFTVPVI